MSSKLYPHVDLFNKNYFKKEGKGYKDDIEISKLRGCFKNPGYIAVIAFAWL